MFATMTFIKGKDMKDVGLDDFYEVRKMGMVSDVDRLSLIDLYQPLIGARSSAIYLTLLEDPTKDDGGLTLTHDKLFAKLVVSAGEFVKSIEALEAVGLVKTFWKEGNGVRYFIYCLYSPKDPKEFFDDVLFVGTLKKYLGKDAFEILAKKYQTSKPVQGFEDVSASFASYFNPDFDDPIYRGKLRYEASGHQASRVKTDFDFGEFVKVLLSNGIKDEELSKAEKSRIEKLAALYSLDGTTMGDIVARRYTIANPVGRRADFRLIEDDCRNSLRFPYLHKASLANKSAITSDTNMAKKIKLMDGISPSNWLTLLQNGHKPADSDLKIVQALSLDLGLPDPVVNALVDFVLQKNDNILSKAYIEKVGAALAREGVKTSLDAIDYLKRTNDKMSGQTANRFRRQTEENATESETQKTDVGVETERVVTNEEVDKALAAFYNKK